MALRRCATPGCTGTLPAGTGTHCPRCGSAEFIRPSRKVLRIFFLFVVVVVGLVTTLLIVNHEPAPSPQRQALMEARGVAARMSGTTARDAAYADIVHRALAQHDFEYACTLGGEMSGTSAKDECLLEIVQESLKAHETRWASRAADLVSQTTVRDDALRQIMDSKSGQETASKK